MNTRRLSRCLAWLAAMLWVNAWAGTAPAPAPPAFELEKYQFILLRRPEAPRDYPKEELERIQAAHLAHLRSLAVAGKLMVAGPLDDQPDVRWRGICIFRASGVEEARHLAEDDPAVKAGRLEVVAMTWYTEKGALQFPVAERLSHEAK